MRSRILTLSLQIPRSSFTFTQTHSFSLSIPKTNTLPSLIFFRHPFSHSTSASKTTNPSSSSSSSSSSPLSKNDTVLFIPPGIEPSDVTDSAILPGSNIVVGPYAGDAKVKEVEFIKSSARARDCPIDDRPEFAILGRSNVGKSSLINSLVRRKEIALTSKKPGKTQLINHFLVNKSWYLVDLPGYGFAKAPEAAKMDWSSFTKGYFLNRSTLVGVLLLIDASVPPQKIDLDCANWLGRNKIPITFVFTKCDKMKVTKGKRPDENIRDFQEFIRQNYKQYPAWIMTSSVSGVGRDELLLHMSQLRNYWDQ
ncbi:putative GTP-binding protein, ribosome biogenesis, YsxC [Lupinus albus]|uniref:Putative GTP-binding protein, ribosome biogenesis, YsxC n=1 Tax=Lupinus albus TaxID=3870 RepID=A0A6A4P641_LUPAL|nr:putative GTP-binding protein, ribosome biogenesis, YsxC [Lupinus albus]